jgi:hypothetical protein
VARGTQVPEPKRARISIPSLVAAAQRITKGSGQGLGRLGQPWQQQAFAFYYTVPEAWYASQFYARALSKLRLFAGIQGPDGNIDELDEGHPASIEFDRVQDQGGGRSKLLGAYGRLMFLNGDGYLIGTQPEDEEEDEYFEFLSVNELRRQGDRFYRMRAPFVTGEELLEADDESFADQGDRVRVYRLYRPSPEFSLWADSPMRAVLGLFEELVRFEMAVRARQESRLASAGGILFIPDDITFPNVGTEGEEDQKTDPFMSQLHATMMAAIQNPGSAAALVPIVVHADRESIAAVKFLRIHDPNETYQEQGLRQEIIKRIATGMDMPPELLLGMADANHWTAWQIDDQTWTAHLQPVAQQLVDDLTAAFLRPLMRDQGVSEWRDIVVAYDPSSVINHPDRAKDAISLFDRGELSGEKLREVTGFSEDDRQTEQEHAEYLAIKLRDPLLLDEENLGTAPGADNASDVLEQPPSEENLRDEDAQVASALLARVAGAAELSTIRARELAGSRLVSKARNGSNGCPDCAERIALVEQGMVASALGHEQVKDFGLTPAALVAGSTETFRACLGAWGVEQGKAKRLSQLIEQHAAKHLFGPHEPLPAAFTSYAAKLL